MRPLSSAPSTFRNGHTTQDHEIDKQPKVMAIGGNARDVRDRKTPQFATKSHDRGTGLKIWEPSITRPSVRLTLDVMTTCDMSGICPPALGSWRACYDRKGFTLESHRDSPREEETQAMNILDAIGNTSMVRLSKVVPAGCADILVKLEWENPTGSVKDRMAQVVISRAEADGRLKPGGTVVEYTGGSTGTSLALVCAAKEYRLRIVSSDAFSREKLDHMAALGAELTLVPSEGGLTTKKLILDMIETARVLSREPNTYWSDQLNNQDTLAGYYALGEEIWSQTKGEIDAFVHCVGTAASSRGVATVLKRYKPSIRIVAVEPGESAVLLGGPPGPHKIEGVGIGYTPPLWEPKLVDEIVAVGTNDAKEMARRVAREEAVFAGTSSGANVVAAIRVGERLGPNAKVVTLMVDSGLKYVSTDVYRTR